MYPKNQKQSYNKKAIYYIIHFCLYFIIFFLFLFFSFFLFLSILTPIKALGSCSNIEEFFLNHHELGHISNQWLENFIVAHQIQ